MKLVVRLIIGFLCAGVCSPAAVLLPKTIRQSLEINKQQGQNATDDVARIRSKLSSEVNLESSMEVSQSSGDQKGVRDQHTKTPDLPDFITASEVSSNKLTASVQNREDLNSSKYRISQLPTYLVPVDEIQPTIASKSSAATLKSSTALPVPSSIYQSNIKIRNFDRSDFLQTVSSLIGANANTTSTRHVSKLEPSSISVSKLMTATGQPELHRQLQAIFKISNPAKTPLQICIKPDVVVTIQCLGNFARLFFLAETITDAKVLLLPDKMEEKLDSKSVIYVHWWNNNGIPNTGLYKVLTLDHVKRTCHECRNQNVKLLLYEEDHGCVIPVICSTQESSIIGVDTANEDATPVFSASLSLHNADSDVELHSLDNVKSGQTLAVTIRGTSESFAVGLYVKQCHIRVNDGPAIHLLSNGCSVSNLLENFNMTSKLVNKIEVFSFNSRLTAYNSGTVNQKLTFNCLIVICEGKCDIHPSCQVLLTPRKNLRKSRIVFEGNLQKSLVVEPEEIQQHQEDPLEGKKEPLIKQIKENHFGTGSSPENFVSKQRFYATIVLLTCVYLVLLAFCVIRIKHSMSRRSNYGSTPGAGMESTPDRSALIMDHNSARRRSPTAEIFID